MLKVEAKMKKNDYTKLQLANALKTLAEETPLKSVTVQAIVNSCGFNRGTFYYHFYDKQELINWIYHFEITEPTRKFLADDPKQWPQISKYGLDIMYRSRNFYIQALRMSGQNNLAEYIKGEIEGNWNIMVDRYANICYPLAAQKDMSFFANFMANGAWAMLMKWVETDMQETPAALANLLDTIAGHSMEAIIAQYME